MNYISIEKLNNIIDNKENFYYSLLSSGFYLPEYTSRAITFNWLWNIWTNKVHWMKRDIIKQGILYKKYPK